MNSRTTARFRAQLSEAPPLIRRQARAAYLRFRADPHHPGLRFKQVHAHKPIYSVRINRDWRVVGVLDGDTVVWFWISPHQPYEQLLRNL